MPYQIAFTKKLEVAERGHYLSQECHGGDVVAKQLLPFVRANYPGVLLTQEKWGWHIFLKDDGAVLSVQIICDNFAAGAFRVIVVSKIKKMFFGSKVQDVPELKYLMGLVTHVIEDWTEEPCRITELSSVKN